MDTIAERTGWARRDLAAAGAAPGDDYVVPAHLDAAPSRYTIAAAASASASASAGAGAAPTSDPYPLGPVPKGTAGAVLAHVESNRRITAEDHDQDVRQIVLRVPPSFAYEPGDVAAVMPSALPARVDAFLALFPEIDPDAEIVVAPRRRSEAAAAAAAASATGCSGESSRAGTAAVDASAPVPPARTTARQLLTRFLDVGAVPRARFFSLLAPFASDPKERDRLAYFGAPSGCDDLQRYSFAMRRTVVEALADFPSARPPLEHLLDIVPRFRERYFSIASALAYTDAGAAEGCVCLFFLGFFFFFFSFQNLIFSRFFFFSTARTATWSLPLPWCGTTRGCRASGSVCAAPGSRRSPRAPPCPCGCASRRSASRRGPRCPS
jgi:hypothetical protein